MNSKAPNIVFILQDHQAYYGHGELGNGPKILRPNFERVANEGIKFTEAYTACPLCGPARRTILTGLYPHNHGEIYNESNEKYLNENYLNILAENGYKNYYFGKWHAGRGTALDFQCEGFSVPGYGNPYITPEYEEYLKENNLPFMEVKVDKNFDDPISKHLKIKEGKTYQPKFPAYSEYITGIMTTPKESHEAYFLASLACKTLEEIAKDESKQPFHLRIDFWGPHEPYFATQDFIDMYNPLEIPKHPNFEDELKDKPSFYKFQNGDLLSRDKKLIQPNPLKWSEWQKVLRINYAEQTLIDAAAGLVLDKIEELGFSDNTMIIWSADHGDAVACHGGHFDKDAYMPQEMVKIPLALKYPEEIKPNQIINQYISNLDFGPTFLDVAGLSYSNQVDGKSFYSICKNIESEWRDHIVSETHGHFNKVIGRMVIKDNMKYIMNEGYTDELYDLKQDPYELNNLINYDAYSEIAKDLKSLIEIWRDEYKDTISYDSIKGKKLIK